MREDGAKFELFLSPPHQHTPSFMKKSTSSYVEPAPYLAMLIQQSSSLTARMHHNSQKRINTSKLFWDLGDLTLTQRSQKHPSASLEHNTADSAAQEAPNTRVLSLSFFNLCVYFRCSCKRLCVQLYYCCLRLSLILPTSHLQLHKRLSGYIYPAVSSMEMRVIGWVSVKCVIGGTGVHTEEQIEMHPPSSRDGYF